MEVVHVGLAAGPGSLPSPGRTSPVRTRAATRTVAANPPRILGLLAGLKRNRGAMAVLLSCWLRGDGGDARVWPRPSVWGLLSVAAGWSAWPSWSLLAAWTGSVGCRL